LTVSTIRARTIDGGSVTVAADDLQFKVSVYGVVIREDEVLLVPQWDGYDIPGGGVELGESLRSAIVREVYEETGLTVEPDIARVLCVADDFFIHPSDSLPYHYLLLYFPCTCVGGVLTDRNLGDAERRYSRLAEWVSVNDLEGKRFYNPVDSAAIIKAARDRIPAPGRSGADSDG
jgi:8-oxo-dGTP diphosphatase